MADYQFAACPGGKTFGTIRDNRGVVVGDASGHAQVIGTQNNYNHYPEEKLPQIRRWLSAPDPSTNYHKAFKLRHAHTGGWFLEGREYTRWKIEAPSYLWLYGIPGCGKTVLFSAILHDVFQHCRAGRRRAAAYFFFDFKEAEKQNLGKMLRSLIWQLSQQSDQIPGSLDDLFSSCDSGQREPSVDQLQEVLRLMIHALPQVYVILDALDECAQRAELTEMLQVLAGWRLQNLHLLVTSRRVRDIESILEEFIHQRNRICLQTAVVNRDIQVYVQNRLATDKTLQKWRKDDISREIETVLRDKANGMFRWAACQLDSLAKCRNRAALRKALTTLPPTLDQTYERILSTISDMDSEYAIRILRWLTFSERPLLVKEIAEVVAIDTERDPPFDHGEVLEDPLEALNICSSLVVVTIRKRYKLRGDWAWDWNSDYDESHYDDSHYDNSDYDDSDYDEDSDYDLDSGHFPVNNHEPEEGFVALAHYSVKEYLVSEEIGKGEAAKYSMRDHVCHHVIMAKSCIGYLLQFKQPELPPDLLLIFRLAHYSAKYWPSHARKAGEQTEEIDQLVFRLFTEDSSSYVNCIRMRRSHGPRALLHEPIPDCFINDPLAYAAAEGLTGVVKLLLDTGADVNPKYGLDCFHALVASSDRGYKQIVKLLLDAGTDLKETARARIYGGIALRLASREGHEQIVELLLDAGADADANAHALYAASGRGYEQIVKLMLDVGFKDNAHALYAASEGGYEKLVKSLLGAGADASAIALYAASRRGHERIVELLDDAGPDVDELSKPCGAYCWGECDALCVAFYRGDGQILRLLSDAEEP